MSSDGQSADGGDPTTIPSKQTERSRLVPRHPRFPGIGLAIAIAVGEFLWDAWRPHSAVLGRAEGVRGYHDIKRYPDARLVPGLVLFRWDAPLFFANAELFQEQVLEAVANSALPVRRVVVAAERSRTLT